MAKLMGYADANLKTHDTVSRKVRAKYSAPSPLQGKAATPAATEKKAAAPVKKYKTRKK